MLYLQKVDKHWHGRNGQEKESSTMKCARSLNLRQTDLNRSLGVLIFYNFPLLPILDPIYLYFGITKNKT